MDLYILLLKYKILKIPERCPNCDQIMNGSRCTNRTCDVKKATKWFGITRIKYCKK